MKPEQEKQSALTEKEYGGPSLEEINSKLRHLDFDPSRVMKKKTPPEVMKKSHDYLQSLAKPRQPMEFGSDAAARYLYSQVKTHYDQHCLDFVSLEHVLLPLLYSVTGFEGLTDAAQLTNSNLLVQSLGRDSECLISPEKGFFLVGKVGTGKTMLVNTLRKAANKLQRQFPVYGMGTMLHAGNMCLSYEREGAEVMDSWPKNAVTIDELGADRVSSKYGNKLNPVEQWLLIDRYPLFVERGVKTHIISNLSNPDDLSERYDTRTLDRMVQMFNVVDMGDVESFRI